jgi:citronellyl-CoA synthetase
MAVTTVKKSKRDLIPLSRLLKYVWVDMLLRFPKPQVSLVKAVWFLRSISGDSKASIGQFFLKTVQKHPDNIVLFHEDDKWTYKEFNEWVNRLANYFISLGFKKGDVAVVLLDNRPEVLAISMALSKIGAVASLVNYSQRKKALIHSINLSKPKIVIVGAELIDNFAEIEREADSTSANIYVVPHPKFVDTSSYKKFDSLAKDFWGSEPKLDYDIFAKDPTMYVFTSGTTGLPKAAIVTHGRWIKGYCGFGLALMQLEPEDVLYVPLPFYHSTAMIVCWTTVVAGGCSMVLKRKFSASEFWPDIAKYKVTSFGYVGELCKYLLNAPVHPLEKNNTLKSMVGNGLRPAIWDEFKQRFGIEKVGEFYASSEGNLAFFNTFNMDRTMGFSVNKFSIVEYDKENEQPVLDKNGFMKEVGKGNIGLLLGEISDRYPFDGYTEKEKSEKSIVHNVLKKGDAYFNTGDLVFDMGFKHTQFVDRLGDTFRWKSENVSTTEVEGIINQIDGIAESIVYGVEIPNTSGRAGMANIILKEGVTSINFEALLKHLKAELPGYAIPLFLRISDVSTTTETMKHQKAHLKKDGYDFTLVPLDTFYFLMPGENYVLLTDEIKDGIDNSIYRL